MPAEGINPTAFPIAIEHVWTWFTDLDSSRQPGISGLSPISEAELGWYCINRGLRMAGWEIAAIRKLDRVATQREE